MYIGVRVCMYLNVLMDVYVRDRVCVCVYMYMRMFMCMSRRV